MRKRFTTVARCGYCKADTSFRLVAERDQQGRALMVCAVCGRREPQRSGEREPGGASS